MKIVILDSSAMGEDTDLSPLSRLGEVTAYESTAPDAVAGRIAACDVVVLNKVRLGEEQLKNSPVRLICVTATGYDNIDTVYCRSHGVAVCNVRGYSTDSVAQITLSIVLQLVCRMSTYTAHVQSGAYAAGGRANLLSPTYHELAGKTWGIVGLGAIGRKVAAIAEAFGCRVIGVKRTPIPEYPCVDLDTLLRESDVITVHTPLTDATRGMIGAAQIAQMKPTAILVNLARGAVLDEEAVADAVKKGRIAGFGTDVYSAEPFPATHPMASLIGMDNVCMTPHMAWGAYEARERCIAEVVRNIEAFLRGEARNRV